MKKQKLIINLLITNLSKEIDDILSIINQGFDLHIYTQFPEVVLALKYLLNLQLQNNPSSFYIAEDSENLTKKIEENPELGFIPVILIGEQSLPVGNGFARYNLQSPDKILNKIANAVQEILTTFNLENYLDCFDGKVFSKLKEIAKSCGVHALIDAVVQTAFLAGLQGDTNSALYYLNEYNREWDKNISNSSISLDSCAKRFLAHCITRGDEAMTYLKSCLCYYVVDHQGRSMTQASQILNMSRTTLGEYLKNSEKFEIAQFFHSSR